MEEPKIIYCPKCHERVGVYDGKQTINIITRCENCNKRVVYHVDTGVTEIKNMPKRNCASGTTFA